MSIARAREQRGWTQRQLAKRLGVAQQTVSRWESGRGTPGRAARSALISLLTSAMPDDSPVLAMEVSTPVRPLVPSLPFHMLAPEAFEAFAAEWIQLRHPGVDGVHRYGGPGDAQRGIDLLVHLADGSRVDYQCKRRQRFGPRKVEEAVAANRAEARHHYILLARDIASAGARAAIDKYPSWTLLDGQDISRMIRTQLPPDDAARLVDAYFPGGFFREHFLGLPEPGAWMTPDEFFRPFERRDRTFSHAWTSVGRDRELEEIVEQLITSPSAAFVLSGRGGSGKTRLLKDVARRFASHPRGGPVRFLSTMASAELRQVERLPQGRILLVVDDAHDRTDIPAFLEAVARLRPEARILIATRPYGVTRILGELRRHNAVGFDAPPQLELENLSDDDVTALAEEVLRELSGEHADAETHAPFIAETTRDCPLLTVVGAIVVAHEGVSPRLLGDGETFRRVVLNAFADAITGGFSNGDGRSVRGVLELISLLQPVRSDDPAFLEIATAVTDLTEDRVVREIRTLHEAGILLRRGRLIQVVPDLLADYLVAEATFDTRMGVSTRYADRVFEHAADKYVENLLVNLSRLDWHVSTSRGLQTNLLDDIWHEVTERFRASGILGREALLKGSRRVSLYQPERVLSLVHTAISEPTEELEVDYSALFPELSTEDYSTVLHELPHLLRGIAHNLRFTQEAAELLWQLGRDDARPTNSHSDHPIRVIEELSAYEPGKPLPYNQAIADAAIRWLKTSQVGSYAHSPFEVLTPILATEGHDLSLRGHAFQFNPYLVRPDVVRPLRTKVIDAAFESIGDPNLAVAAGAVRFLKDALRRPSGQFGKKVSEADAAAWLPDIVVVLERFKDCVTTQELDPVVLDEIASVVSWQAAHGPDEARTAARRVIAAIPDSLSYRVTTAITHTWLRALGESAEGYIDAEALVQERREAVVSELLEAFPPRDVVETIIERLTTLGSARLRPTPSPGAFISTICMASQEVMNGLVEQVVHDPESPLGAEFATLLGVLQYRDRAAAAKLAEECLDSGRPDLVRGVAQVYGWGLRRAEAPTDDEVMLVIRLTKFADTHVLATTAHAAPAVAAINPASGIALLLALLEHGASDVLDAAFAQFGDHGGLSIDDLTEEQLSAFDAHLLRAPSIGGYHVGAFLGELSLRDPMRVVRLMMGRVDEAGGGKDRAAHEPIPAGWDEGSPLRIRETPWLLDVLREIRNWLRSAHEEQSSRRYWGAQLFSAVSGTYDDTVVSLLRERLHSDDPEDFAVIGALVSEAPRSFVRDNPTFVQDVLEQSWGLGIGIYKRVKNTFHRTATAGMRSGVPGEPFPEDIEQRDWAREMSSTVAPGSPAHRFYDELRRSAEESIRYNLERDAEDFVLS